MAISVIKMMGTSWHISVIFGKTFSKSLESMLKRTNEYEEIFHNLLCHEIWDTCPVDNSSCIG